MDTVYIVRARSMNINVCIDLAFVTKIDKFVSFVEIQLNSLCKTLIILAIVRLYLLWNDWKFEEKN